MDMSQPIFPAPAGYIVDLENPQRSGVTSNLWVGSVGMVIATLFLGIRIYTKAVLARHFSADDVSIALAWVFSTVIQIIILYQYGRGTLGVHIWELSGYNVNSALNLITVATILYCPFLACAKFSLLFFYLRLSHLTWFRIAVYANMFLVVGYNIALVFPMIFTCKPIMKNFDVSIVEGTCLNRTPMYMATAVLNMVTDIILLVLPIPMIMQLQMPRVQKAGVLCIFAVGSATCITSGVRLGLLFPMLKTFDQTWAIVTPGLWILIEANLVIITGSLPVMRLFLRHIAPTVFGESSVRSGGLSRKYGAGYGTGTKGTRFTARGHNTELHSFANQKRPTVHSIYGRVSDDSITQLGSEERVLGTAWKIDADASSETNIVDPFKKDGAIIKTQTTVVKTEEAAVPQKEREGV